jgi:2-iminobutanoate/2-iminopropanoate deaminase
MLLRTIFIFSFLSISTFTVMGDADVKYLRSDTFKEKKIPLSEAVRVGNLLFLSGNLGIDFSKEGLALVPGGIVAETKQTMLNIENTLKNSGSSLDKLVKCTLFMANIDEWPQINEIWPSYFDENFPARTAVEVGRLWEGAAIEIECIAYVD